MVFGSVRPKMGEKMDLTIRGKGEKYWYMYLHLPWERMSRTGGMEGGEVQSLHEKRAPRERETTRHRKVPSNDGGKNEGFSDRQ